MHRDDDFDFSIAGDHGINQSAIDHSYSEKHETDTWFLDNVELTTVGVDVGSSTSHLVFSKLHMQRLAQSLSSRFVVVERIELHRSPILLTPFLDDSTIDVDTLSRFVQQSYTDAGISPDEVDTGVVILTGVALERKNSRAVAELFASFGGKFVCASAGHNLEGILAAHGSGAVALSRKNHAQVLHIDIGGGTSKLAVISNGEILETSAISIGARLIAFDDNKILSRIESAAETLANYLGINLHIGEKIADDDIQAISRLQAEILVSYALGSDNHELMSKLILTSELSTRRDSQPTITFSGGVSEYLFDHESVVYNDMAMHLSNAIKREFENRELPFRSGGEGIRATAVGASQFTVQLSGNTILVSNEIQLPMHNIPVVCPKLPEFPTASDVSEGIEIALQRLDIDTISQPICIYLPWHGEGEYSALMALATGVAQAVENKFHSKSQPLVLALETDMGAAIGRLLREEAGLEVPLVSIDGVELRELDFIDLGKPLEPSKVLPVMVKSLAFPAN